MSLTSPLTERPTLECKRAHYSAEEEMSQSALDTARLEYVMSLAPQIGLASILGMQAKQKYTLAEFRAAVDAARAR